MLYNSDEQNRPNLCYCLFCKLYIKVEKFYFFEVNDKVKHKKKNIKPKTLYNHI